MEVPGSQNPGISAHIYHMRLPTAPGLPSSQQATSAGQMPEQWPPGMQPDNLASLGWADATMCASSQTHPWPRSHCWGSASTPWRQEVPSTMPWAGRRPGMVSFTGVPPCSNSPPDRTRPTAVTCKRRLEKGEEEPTSKHFLTEDMMADHFNCLSLENDHAYGTTGFPSRGHPDGKWHQWLSDYTRFQELEGRLQPDQPVSTVDEKAKEDTVLVEGEYTMGDTPVLTVSPELQESLRDAGAGSILPESVLRSMEFIVSLYRVFRFVPRFLDANNIKNHPCMELVLWKPPGNLIHEAIRSLTRQRDDSRDRDGCIGCTVPQVGASRSVYAHRFNTDSRRSSPQRGVLQDTDDAMEL